MWVFNIDELCVLILLLLIVSPKEGVIEDVGLFDTVIESELIGDDDAVTDITDESEGL